MSAAGNWSAAIALMDKATLLKPPLTLTSEILVRSLQQSGAVRVVSTAYG